MAASVTGLGLAFPPRLNDRDRMAMVEDDAKIRQSIYIIINTVPGERVMRPDFGCRIHELIFDPANEQTASTAERYVREALQRWEPRINIINVHVTPGGAQRAELMINIEYQIKEQVDRRSLIYPYYLLPAE